MRLSSRWGDQRGSETSPKISQKTYHKGHQSMIAYKAGLEKDRLVLGGQEMPTYSITIPLDKPCGSIVPVQGFIPSSNPCAQVRKSTLICFLPFNY
jgi:hypothetical protein